MNIFVTGTDTDVGKTIVSAWVCMHTPVSYWKPIQTGGDSDKDIIAKLSPHTKIIPETYKFKAPLSPYDAANMENIAVDIDKFSENFENTIIEGAGGALVPIAENFFMADLIKKCNASVLIVVKSKLGMINHLLMTAEVLKMRGIRVVGIVVNGKMEDNIKFTIEKFSKVRILRIIPDDSVETLRCTAVPPEILEIIK
ncbi:MAG: dethiobiotin synthase [Puniceicoccales bacterium]|jgi:dethiobiotin synthase|nr:dethiobiotin synthase [Puniceicoccales bacterium]